MRVTVVVEEHRAAGSALELAIPPALRADRLADGRAIATNGVGWMGPCSLRIASQREKAVPFQSGWRTNTGRFAKRWKNIEKLYRSRRRLPHRTAGRADDERHAASDLKHRTVLRPFTFFAQMIAMVAEQNNHGLVAQLEPIDRFHQAAKLPID